MEVEVLYETFLLVSSLSKYCAKQYLHDKILVKDWIIKPPGLGTEGAVIPARDVIGDSLVVRGKAAKTTNRLESCTSTYQATQR